MSKTHYIFNRRTWILVFIGMYLLLTALSIWVGDLSFAFNEEVMRIEVDFNEMFDDGVYAALVAILWVSKRVTCE